MAAMLSIVEHDISKKSALSKYESEAENKSRRHREWDNYNLRNIYLNETQKKANKETDFDSNEQGRELPT